MRLYGDVKGVYNIGELIHHYKNTRTGSITGSFTVSGTASGAAPQLIWESRVDANDYTSILWNGFMLYATKAKAGFITEYVTIAASLVADSVHTYQLDSYANFTLQLYLDGAPALAGLSTERVVNGTFSVDSGWIKGTGWTIPTPVAHTTGAINQNINQNITPITEFRAVYSTITISNVIGSPLSTRLWSTVEGNRIYPSDISSEGVYAGSSIITKTITNVGVTSLGTNVSSYDVDNVSVKEIYNSTSSAFPPVITGSYTT